MTKRAAGFLAVVALSIFAVACSSTAPAASGGGGGAGDGDGANGTGDSSGSLRGPNGDAGTGEGSTTVPGGSPWASLASCEADVAARQLAPRAKGTARVATWNIRWFPLGVMPNSGDTPKPTDLAWLACAMVWLDADVIVVEEVTTNATAKTAMDTVIARMHQLNGGDWRADIDPCIHPDAQHQGFIYDATRATITHDHRYDFRSGDYCNLSMRPAWTGYVQFATGLDTHLAAVHLKSGVDATSYDLRRGALAAFSAMDANMQGDVADDDVVVTGDFNSMGCTDSANHHTSDEEIATLEQEAQSAGLRRLGASTTCSEYSGWSRHLLDHYLVAAGMQEVPQTAQAVVSGYCAELSCGSAGSTPPAAQNSLSDHCPVILDLDGRDLD